MRITRGETVASPVVIPAGPGVALDGDLAVPAGASTLVIFVHGSGSSRFSRRNRLVAEKLQQANLATLLFDLLTEAEESEDAIDARHRFNLGLLSGRLRQATLWAARSAESSGLKPAYFGASTGAAAALIAASEPTSRVISVVSRGGRPDLADEALPRVRAPVLLIVGGDDAPVVDMNLAALARLRCRKRMEIVPGAGHLFEEPGALERVSELARDWIVEGSAA